MWKKQRPTLRSEHPPSPRFLLTSVDLSRSGLLRHNPFISVQKDSCPVRAAPGLTLASHLPYSQSIRPVETPGLQTELSLLSGEVLCVVLSSCGYLWKPDLPVGFTHWIFSCAGFSV